VSFEAFGDRNTKKNYKCTSQVGKNELKKMVILFSYIPIYLSIRTQKIIVTFNI